MRSICALKTALRHQRRDVGELRPADAPDAENLRALEENARQIDLDPLADELPDGGVAAVQREALENTPRRPDCRRCR
jgi:hypothetical protein